METWDKGFEDMRVAEIALACGVNRATVGDWIKRGCPKNADKVRMSLPIVIKWLQQRERELAGGVSHPGPDGKFTSSQLRRQKALADMAEDERDRRRGEVFLKVEVEAREVQIAQAFRASILGLPREMAGRLQGLNAGEIEKALRDRCTAVLRCLSECRDPESINAVDA